MIPSTHVSIATRLLYREAALLDERRWDDWIALFAQHCEYWVPTWRTEAELATDPQRELSHIYYASRAGLEDRLVRIRSGRSPATTPMRRTAHCVSNIELLNAAEDRLEVRSTWANHVFDPHHRTQLVLFGWSEHRLEYGSGGWLIARKKIVLQNDQLPAMIDIYCL